MDCRSVVYFACGTVAHVSMLCIVGGGATQPLYVVCYEEYAAPRQVGSEVAMWVVDLSTRGETKAAVCGSNGMDVGTMSCYQGQGYLIFK